MNTLVMFAKAPVPGRVKTRLAATIGDERAAAFHRAFLDDLCADLAASLPESTRRVLSHSGDPEHPAFVRATELGWSLTPQPSGGLGERLEHTSRWAFEEFGASAIAFIGSDAPTLSHEHVTSAFAALEDASVSITPSSDGGYVLLSAREHTPELFGHGVWSSHRTFGATLGAAHRVGASVHVAPMWYDVDTFEDLEFLYDHLVLHLARPMGREYGETIRQLRELEREGILRGPSS